MADARISQLPAATTVASTDIIPFTSISASETRKITANNLGIALTSLGLSVGSSVPSTPYNGQMWVDTSTNPPVLKVYNGASFTTVSFLPGSSIATSPSSTAPTSPALGQLWLDTSQTPDELKVYDGAAFVRVDPLGITDTAAAAKYLQITNAAATYLALAGGTMTGNLTLSGAPTTNNMAATKKYVDDEISGIPAATDLTPAGTVIYSARSTAPTGYLKANGAAVSRTTYSDLFSAIGTTYGSGDGSTTFNVPDLRGEFLRGLDDSRGVDSGRTLGSAQGSQNLQHNHTASASSSVNDPGHFHSFTAQQNIGGFTDDGGSPDQRSAAAARDTASKPTGITVSTSVTVNNDGGSEARPRNIALLACIKT